MERGEPSNVITAPAPIDPAGDAAWRNSQAWFRRAARRAAAAVIDFIVPPTCLACRIPVRDPQSLCGTCWGKIDFVTAPLCDRLGIPLPFDIGGTALSAAAIAVPPKYDHARFVAAYDGVMRELIHGFKYADRHDATNLFARWMQRAAASLIEPGDLIVPVPLDPLRLLARRYNQAALLAQALARQTAGQYAPDALVRTRRTARQVGLSVNERVANVRGAFAVPPRHLAKVAGRRVLLIDDVITTGATIDACTLALRRAGAASVNVAALARVLDPVRPPV